jgi:tetratricopeptide (TPR) repeat protein
MIRKIFFIIIFCCLFLIPVVYAGSYSCSGTSCSDNDQIALKQFNAAERYYSARNYTYALSAYMTAADLDYKKCYCEEKIITIYLKLDQANSALTRSRSALTPCEQDKQLWKLQGDAFTALGRYDDAANSYSNAGSSTRPTQKTIAFTPSSTYSAVQPEATLTRASAVHDMIFSEDDPFISMISRFCLGIVLILLFALVKFVVLPNSEHAKKDKEVWTQVGEHGKSHGAIVISEFLIDYIIYKFFEHTSSYYIGGAVLLYLWTPFFKFLYSIFF